MSPEKVNIAIVGSGFSLSICAAYLSEKLRYLNPVIIAIKLPSQEHDSGVSFAFPQFAEPLAPMLRRLVTESSLDKVSLISEASPQGFAFNFAHYGVVSGAVTFPHAYEICRQHSAGLPSYDSFLGAQAPPSLGVLYARQPLATQFQYLAVRNNVVFVSAKHLDVSLTADHEILSVKTSDGQVVAADYFIDCSAGGMVMQRLQQKHAVSGKTVPPWSVGSFVDGGTRGKSSVSLQFDRSQVNCAGNINGERHQKVYDFENHDQHCEHFRQPWLGNCVALGRGFANFPEFLIDTDRLLERQLATLSWLLGVNPDTTYTSRHFNRLSIRHLNEVIDTVNLLLRPTFADQLELTERNHRRVALFGSSASTLKEDNSLVSENAWTGLLHFIGVSPKSANAVSAATNPKRIIDRTKSLLSR